MNVYINGRFLTRPVTGVERYAIEVVKAFDSLIDCGEIDIKKYSFLIVTPKRIKDIFLLKHIPLKKIGMLSGHLWEQVELPLYARGGLLLSLCNASTLFRRNQIVTIHDAAFAAYPSAFSLIFRTWYKILSTNLGKIANKIITDSFFSKADLQRYCGIPGEKIKVIYCGGNHLLKVDANKEILIRNSLTQRPYVLAVGTATFNKNFHAIVNSIDLLKEMNVDLVIVGGNKPTVFKQAPLPYSRNTKYLGYVSDAELRALYEGAACYVHPSLYEGFGLPPLEAMACRCPVILSGRGSLPEVFGDAALYCNAFDSEDIANKIRQLIGDKTLQENFRQKGSTFANRFSWKQCAKEITSTIEECFQMESLSS